MRLLVGDPRQPREILTQRNERITCPQKTLNYYIPWSSLHALARNLDAPQLLIAGKSTTFLGRTLYVMVEVGIHRREQERGCAKHNAERADIKKNPGERVS